MNIFEYEDLMRNQQQPAPGAAMAQPQGMAQGPGGIMSGSNIPGLTMNDRAEDFQTQEGGPPKLLKQDDVSGFANAGMTAPDIGNPMAQLKGLMTMNANEPRRQQQMPGGGLMAYLMSLGAR